MAREEIKQIPYGVADFVSVREQNFLEGGGGEACAIDQVGPCERLPAVADVAGMLYLLAPYLHPIADHLGLGGYETIFLLGYLEGAQGLAIGTV